MSNLSIFFRDCIVFFSVFLIQFYWNILFFKTILYTNIYLYRIDNLSAEHQKTLENILAEMTKFWRIGKN